MTVLLTILKVIGILLLVVLGILFAVVLTVLFVPVRYCAEGEYREKLWAKGQITWLLHLLSVSFSFEEELSYSVKIAGIRILPGREKKKPQEKKPQGKNLPEEKEEPECGRTALAGAGESAAAECAASAAAPDEPQAESVSDKSSSARDPDAGRAEEHAETEKGGTEAEQTFEKGEDAEAADGPFSFPERLLQKVYAIFRKYREKYETICVKIKKVKDKLSYYIRILKREETKELLQLTVSQLRRVLRHMLPRKLDVCLQIGTGDPASTGQLLALQGILYPVLGGNVCIIPDFEEKRFEGTFYMKGRITAFVLLFGALRVAINKNFRRLIRILRKKEDA